MTAENTKIWDQLKRVPPEHLKGFQRSGGFRGTAIKPMWTIHKMTEVFGPCGKGWGVDRPEFQIVTAGNELLVFCTVALWHGNVDGPRTYGVGGDKVCVVQSNGPRNDDEAFKKAYTDAITNACKMIGAGADVHMGLWDGNKYADDVSSDMGLVNGTQGTSKAASRDDYARHVKAIENCMTVTALQAWFKNNGAEVDKLPTDWVDELRIEYSDRMSELKKRAAA
jgi:hypothetical protein